MRSFACVESNVAMHVGRLTAIACRIVVELMRAAECEVHSPRSMRRDCSKAQCWVAVSLIWAELSSHPADRCLCVQTHTVTVAPLVLHAVATALQHMHLLVAAVVVAVVVLQVHCRHYRAVVVLPCKIMSSSSVGCA